MIFDYAWVDAVRRRPGMYIGPTDQRAVITLLAELVDTALADHHDPPCRHVQLRVTRENQLVAQLDGGVPPPLGIGTPPLDRPEALVTALASLLERPDERTLAPLALMSAYAARLTIEVDAGGMGYQQSFVRGHPATPVVALGSAGQRGLHVTWEPDQAVIREWTALMVSPLMGLLRTTAALHPGVVCKVSDERDGALMCVRYPDGLAGYLLDQVTTDIVSDERQPLVIDGEWEGVRVVAALLWESWMERTGVDSFANGRGTVAGGSHVRGFWRGLVDGMTAYAQATELFTPRTPRLRRAALARSCRGAVAVWLERPAYGRATRTLLADRRAERAVRQVVAAQLPELIQTKRPDLDGWLRHYARHALDEADEEEAPLGGHMPI